MLIILRQPEGGGAAGDGGGPDQMGTPLVDICRFIHAGRYSMAEASKAQLELLESDDVYPTIDGTHVHCPDW